MAKTKKPAKKPSKKKGVNWGNVEEANERNAASIAQSVRKDRTKKK
jgi:hypothetical protein